MEDHLPTSITQGASDLHSDEDMEDKIKLLDLRVQRLIRTYLEVCGELPPPASCDKLVQMDLKLKPEFLGHEAGWDPRGHLWSLGVCIYGPASRHWLISYSPIHLT